MLGSWQDIGKDGTVGIHSSHSKRINYLGIICPALNELNLYKCEGKINSAFVIDAIDQFVDGLERPAVVLADNAPVHKSKAFTDKLLDWEKRGCSFYFISPYFPELNLIEILWRKIKYDWLPNSAYKGIDCLRTALDKIFGSFGSNEYSIQFSGY
jgi:transposase